MQHFPDIGISIPKILMPDKSVDLKKWAVVACDQFTSEPEYWEKVELLIEDQPSTYHLILPEAYLGTAREYQHQEAISHKMLEYLQSGILNPVDGFIYVERYFNGIKRCGLIGALDLECYDFHKDSKSLIRATEGTILDRIPPRVKIREQAFLEVPHILVLIDDPDLSVIEPISRELSKLNKLYHFDLMMGGGEISGFQINDLNVTNQIITALRKLTSPEIQKQKYGNQVAGENLLFAVGDGNHSLATAKTIWDGIKQHESSSLPARFALVEILNIHDPGISFEPIHRLILNNRIDFLQAAEDFFKNKLSINKFDDFESMASTIIDDKSENSQTIGIFNNKGFFTISLHKPSHTLAVGNIQMFLDDLTNNGVISEIDYIHGYDSIKLLGTHQNNTGIYLPAMRKNQLFRSVVNDGPLPRKTFSMGEAHQKRYYLESRLIKEWPHAK